MGKTKYIDADKLADELSKGPWYEREDEKQAIRMVKEIPSAQPEIIRCKDCKHYYALNEVRGNCSEYNFIEKIPIDFCSLAERKEERQMI